MPRTTDRRSRGLRSPAPTRPLLGELRVPGDKSISHRALILAAIASGPSVFRGVNTGADVRALAHSLAAIGARCAFDDSKAIAEVEGCGWEGLVEPHDVVNVGNSGTSLRLLPAVCAAIDGVTVVTGDESVRSRPMLRVVEPLRRMGALIDGRRSGDRAPLSIRGGPLTGIDFASPVASAQVKTAVLIAGLWAHGPTSVHEPLLSRDHTERMLAARGVPVVRAGSEVSVPGDVRLAPLDHNIPGDISSAMFLIVAALLVPGSDVTITGVGLNPTRTRALDVLTSMGGWIESSVDAEVGGEPVGHIKVKASELHGAAIGGDDIPGVIDEIPALAVAATMAEGDTVISGADELRVKESDRIAALAETLSSLGANIRERPDGLVITGPASLRGGEVDCRGDHRIAMAAAVAGMLAADPVNVRGWEAVATSFPEFLDVIGSAQGRR